MKPNISVPKEWLKKLFAASAQFDTQIAPARDTTAQTIISLIESAKIFLGDKMAE